MWKIQVSREHLLCDSYKVTIKCDKIKIDIEQEATEGELLLTGIKYPEGKEIHHISCYDTLQDWLYELRVTKWLLKFCMNNYKYLLC